MYKKINLLGIVCLCWLSFAQAQNENSPYSRYGLGDYVPQQNILNRGMGGVSAAYYDFNTINFINPASYGRLQATTLDLGVELDNRTLRANNPPRKYSNYSPNISYVQLGFPLKKGGGWGMNLGLRPLSRVNYQIGQAERLNLGVPGDTFDISTIYQGDGGSYEAYLGTGVAITRDLTVGVNFGYLFGNKDYSTKKAILDTLAYYYKSNHQTTTSYGGVLLNAGVQYTARLDKKHWLRFGAYGNLKQTLNAKKDYVAETFEYNSNTGAADTIDVAYRETAVKGDIIYPSMFGAGILFDRLGKWQIGVDYVQQKWSQYSYYGAKDSVQDAWQLKIGAQLTPSGGKNYWNFVSYRAGFQFGQDYIKVDQDLPTWTFSIGAGFPMRKPAYTNQFSVINTVFEVGRRGDNKNLVRESFWRIGIGLSLSDIWFQKYKYD
ncbi:hypothetical protein [Paraflavitalea sp. CAU 1676]|uniref:hypothetical protein n=1 Tax=Paraflavitalea sp. CAU 1676 TaxID=3032598 RepID=UPI0023DC41AC|nr:hypothetical protein [Paraflavitalea sp. CAU 1676]MDF2190808.1 hypothetical protein [Paraflavitalea sp. CAU 1676]